MGAFITVRNLSFAYTAGRPVLDTISTDLLSDRVTGLLGPSGSGKSTLLRLIAGLDSPKTGKIAFAAPSINLSYVTQDAVIFEQYSRRENARYRQQRGDGRDRFKEERFAVLAATLRLDAALLSERRPFEPMSGGQRQRLVLLRELSVRPDILLLDEPCSGLDSAVKREFLVLLRQVIEELGIRCIYATHHFDELNIVGDEILYLPIQRPVPFAPEAVSLGGFMERPPTPDAAVAVLGPLCNRLCMVATMSGFRPAQLGDAGEDILVFPATSATVSPEGYTAARRPDDRPVALMAHGQQTILAATGGQRGSCFMIEGPAFHYRGNTLVSRVYARTAYLEDEWTIVLVPLS